jgi:predicted membrane protein
MPNDARPLVPPRLVLGLVTVVIGALLLADSIDLLRADSALALWPVGVLALGLVVVLQPDTATRMAGAVLLVAGIWLLLNAVGVWSYRFWHTWPYLLIAFGAWMLYRVRSMHERERVDDSITGFAFLNRVDRTATRARSGDFSAVGGECRIDLRTALLGEGRAAVIIDAFALFGRIDLHVPAGCRVESRVLPLLGRVDGVPEQPTATGPVVVVQGAVICGRISVAAASES